MAKINRHDLLRQGGDEEEGGEDARCPCCGAPLEPGSQSGPEAGPETEKGRAARCGTCGYPDNSAAFVDYDGCC